MFQPVYTKGFKKSMARCIKRGYDIELFKEVAYLICSEQPLSQKFRAHKLKGKLSDFWDCHIKADWIILYDYDYERGEVIFVDTGTHADLFG